MQKSTNYGLNLPDLSDQFNLNHWNENTEKLDLELKKETDSRINNDNQLQSNINNSVSTLRNEISTAETNAKNLANATGVLPIAKGGTGKTTILGIQNAILGIMPDYSYEPIDDNSRFVTRYAEPNDIRGVVFTSKATQVWEYIKSKISSLLGLTATQYNGNAKTATNADFSKNMYQQVFDLSGLDKTKFYPLICPRSSTFTEVAIYSLGGSENVEYNQNRIHFDISTEGWNDTPPTFNIKEYACFDTNEITIGCIGRGTNYGGWAIWLRGGLNYTCFSRNIELSLHTSDYNYENEVFTVGTNYYGGTNSNVDVLFTPQSTIKEGAYSTRPITGTFIGNLIGNATNAYNAYRGMVHTCSTASGTASKTVSITGFTLTQGACIRVLFTNGNSVAYPTLNVNGTGAKEIRVKQGSEYVTLSAENGALKQGAYSWDSNTLLELFYTGTYWIVNENAIVHENLNSELGYLSSRVFINGRKEIWGGTSPYDITANESKTMTISSDLPINDDISNHSLSVITEIESTYVNAYGDIKLMDNTLKFSIYSRNLTNNSYRVKTVHIFVTGY